MKVIVLGATGDMGRRAAKELSRSPEVTQLTVAGRDPDKLRTLARELDGHVEIARIDVSDRQNLVAIMKSHDVAAGAIGPFYLYEVPLAEAAIEAGVHYVSINDDHDAAQEVFKLDATAKDRGMTVLSGVGWTPGLTSIMAKKGISLLDEAEKVHIAWVGSSADSEGFAVILHTLHILTGQVPTFREGRMTTVSAGSEPSVVRFPDPIGPVKVRHVGHPEPVTIPKFIPGLQEVSLKGGLTEGLLNTMGLWVARSGLTKTAGGKQRLARLMKPTLPLLERLGKRSAPLSGAHVQVTGVKNGRPASVTLATVGRMRDLTALPHAVVTLMVGRGDVRQPGVIAPEAPGGPDPDQFLEDLAKLGITVEVTVDL